MSPCYIGIDLGGTNMRVGLIQGDQLMQVRSARVKRDGSKEEVLMDLYSLVEELMNEQVMGIGIGVPSVVDLDKGVVYDVQNIPSWIEVPIKQLMEERYRVPTRVNNDANCFALGEFYFGKGKGSSSMIGLTIGTGLGCGIIVNRKLFSGTNCGAGEIGMVDYKDKFVEYYASGQFFQNIYGVRGEEVFQRVQKGDAEAQRQFDELGHHLGNAFKLVLYTYDPELIIIGGSLKDAWPYYSQSLLKQLNTIAYPQSLKRLKIERSDLEHCGILGAASLLLENKDNMPM